MNVYTKPTPDVSLLMREEMEKDEGTQPYSVLIEVGLLATSRKRIIRETISLKTSAYDSS